MPSLTGLADSADCLALIAEFSTTNDEVRVAEIFDALFNYSADNVLNIPLRSPAMWCFIALMPLPTILSRTIPVISRATASYRRNKICEDIWGAKMHPDFLNGYKASLIS